MSDVSRETRDCFSALYHREYATVLGFVKRRCGPNLGSSQAEDLTHETFLTAWRRFENAPTDPERAKAWLLTIARNCLLNTNRGETRRGLFQRRLESEAVLIAPPADSVVAGQSAVATAWASLSAGDREVLALTAVDELNSEQAGAVLGISANAYRHRLSRARAALRKALEHQG